MRRQAYAAIPLMLLIMLPWAPRFVCAQPPLEAPVLTASWQQCLVHYAQSLAINPDLFHAIVQTESAGHPWTLGWTDQPGRRHSYIARRQEDAAGMLHRLLKTASNVDIGIAQISSQHLDWLARHHHIQPHDLLEPCVNLYASSLILHTAIQKHGRTWKAIAGYNGSTAYIPAVWKHFCQRAPDSGCSSGRSAPPLPSTPLPPAYDRGIVETQRHTGGRSITWNSRPFGTQLAFQRSQLENPATDIFDLLNLRALLVVTPALLCGGLGLLLILALGGRLVLLAVYILREGLHSLRRQRATHRHLTAWRH